MVEMSTAVEQSNDIPLNDSCELIKGNMNELYQNSKFKKM